MKLRNTHNTQSGYALFTSIILTGMLVLIAYATTNFAAKQLLLTSGATESHAAFYTADTGLECALYWDLKNPNNPTISAFDASAPTSNITCGGSTSAVTTVVSGSSVSTFQIPVGSSCTIVAVTKNGTNTTIESKGYNTCGSGGARLERAIRITY